MTRELHVDAVYGAFSLLRGWYVAVVTRSVAVALAPTGAQILQVLDMEWLPVGTGEGRPPLSAAEAEEEAAYLALLKELGASRGFYFSHGYDLSQHAQRLDAHNGGRAGGEGGALSPAGGGSGGGAAAPSGADRGSPGSAALAGAEGAGGRGAPAALGLPPKWPELNAAESPYLWNRERVREIAAVPGGLQFIAPFINGFVAGWDCRDLGVPPPSRAAPPPAPGAVARALLISRRAVARQGTRYFSRGLDAEGNAANTVETEQLLLFCDGGVASHVQLRGSIPTLWEQAPTLKYTPRVTFQGDAAPEKPSEQARAAFERHAAAVTRFYGGPVTAVNLVDQGAKAGDQNKLGKAYEVLSAALGGGVGGGGSGGDGGVGAGAAAAGGGGGGGGVGGGGAGGGGAASSSPRRAPWSHIWFDFHRECKSMKYGNLSKLLAQVQGSLDEDGFFFAPGRGVVGGAPRRAQRGVLRTNCLDNLDRTNVVQSVFARAVALEAAGAADAARAAAGAGATVLASPFPAFEGGFNHAWADNADALSLAYAGTGALKTDFTRTGRRTWLGALADGRNSLARYVRNNFSDGRAQDAWDLWTGRYAPERRAPARPSPFAAHKTAPTVAAAAARIGAAWLGLTLVLALVAPRVAGARGGDGAAGSALLAPPTTRHLWMGALGSLAALLGVGAWVVSKGLPPRLVKGLVNKPAFRG